MQYDVLIIGGGIVGLATAWRILEARPGTRLLLLEKEPGLARHQTGRNSGVIHSGIYYKPGSYKARLCRRGYAELIRFCGENAIAHEICGKIIVATEAAELPRLERLAERAGANGLQGVRALSPGEIAEHEPHARGLGALLVPETGIVDYAQVAGKLAEKIREAGGRIVLSAGARAVSTRAGEKIVETQGGEFRAHFLINCAGLFSDRLARLDGLSTDVSIVPFRGEYYLLSPKLEGLVKNLIYPVPDPAFPFLGVHFTRLVRGGVECGPNAVLALKREGYRKSDFDLRDAAEVLSNPGFFRLARRHWSMGLMEVYRSLSKAAFVRALRRLVPGVSEAGLVPAEAGVRAQAMRRDGTLLDDFCFAQGERSLHVLNAPSPAATASLAIGEEIRDRYFKSL